MVAETLRSFPAKRVTGLWRSIRASLDASERHNLTYRDLGKMASRPANTVADWCEGGPTPQICALLGLLERLPREIRHKIIDDACRVFPSFQSQKLAHDFHAIESLSNLLAKRTGLTLVQGQPEHMRTFLTMALGNEYCRLGKSYERLSGLDFHCAEELVPVPGVIYLNLSMGSIFDANQLKAVWSHLKNRNFKCILINGIFNKYPELRSEIIMLSKNTHIIIADSDLQKLIPHATHSIKVTPAREQPAWIHIELQAP